VTASQPADDLPADDLPPPALTNRGADIEARIVAMMRDLAPHADPASADFHAIRADVADRVLWQEGLA